MLHDTFKFPAVYVIADNDPYGELVRSDGKVRISSSGGSIEKGTYYRYRTKLDKPKNPSVANSTGGVTVKWNKSDGANAYYISRNGWKED